MSAALEHTSRASRMDVKSFYPGIEALHLDEATFDLEIQVSQHSPFSHSNLKFQVRGGAIVRAHRFIMAAKFPSLYLRLYPHNNSGTVRLEWPRFTEK